jgi:hypothetical protein
VVARSEAAVERMTTKPGVIASALVGVLLLAFAVSVDFPKANGDRFKGDESTYYMLGHSLARDFDFQYERKDLIRVWEEFSGPEGVFLKTGKDIEIRGSSAFPFFERLKREDPERETRLYFSKSYIYPLVAAPFIAVFGTNGFLVLHAILIALDLLVVYLFVLAVTKSNWVSVPMAAAFLATSVVPVYFVWLMPELFNFSLVLYAVFFWVYKEVAAPAFAQPSPTASADKPTPTDASIGRNAPIAPILLGSASDYIAAFFIGLATFSKPPHLLVLGPMVLLAVSRRQWARAASVIAICGAVTAALFALNAAVTGEFNYQGGDRKTFYSSRGFPFANSWETFDNIGSVHGREDLMIGDVLVNTHSAAVLRHNLWYFLVGRNAGLLPYFFPGIVAVILFLLSRQKQRWQWLSLATIVGVIVFHVFVWPFTWNGGGGPVGSRYFLPFYALFLVLIPATIGLGSAIAAFVVGALFTAPLVLNPFYASLRPGDHTKSGALRLLPTELTLLHDLPVAQDRDRMRRTIGPPDPNGQAMAYFVDDNAFFPEEKPPVSKDWWFWTKGNATAEIVLRGPVASLGNNDWQTKAITGLTLEVLNGGASNHVTVATDNDSETFPMTPGELRVVTLTVPAGVPFRREIQPTSYLYNLSVTTTAGFVPFLEVPCEAPRKCGSTDSRFLGAMIHVIPEYTDADITRGWVPPGGAAVPQKGDASGVLDTR